MIDSYQFGKIVIDGQEYENDIMIHPDGRIEKWWRKEGHIVALDDLQTLLNDSPEIMIIGAGCPGMMALPGNIITFLQEFLKKILGFAVIIIMMLISCNSFLVF